MDIELPSNYHLNSRLAPGVELSWTASWEGILGGSEAPTTFTAGEKLANLKRREM